MSNSMLVCYNFTSLCKWKKVVLKENELEQIYFHKNVFVIGDDSRGKKSEVETTKAPALIQVRLRTE